MEQAKQELGLPADATLITVSAKIEDDLKDLSAEDAKEFLDDLGVTDSGLNRLIRAAYEALGYITYFTAGVKEVRAWNIPAGSTAPQAAGAIHTDFEKGFIRAETIAYQDYATLGGEQKPKRPASFAKKEKSTL